MDALKFKSNISITSTRLEIKDLMHDVPEKDEEYLAVLNSVAQEHGIAVSKIVDLDTHSDASVALFGKELRDRLAEFHAKAVPLLIPIGISDAFKEFRWGVAHAAHVAGQVRVTLFDPARFISKFSREEPDYYARLETIASQCKTVNLKDSGSTTLPSGKLSAMMIENYLASLKYITDPMTPLLDRPGTGWCPLGTNAWGSSIVVVDGTPDTSENSDLPNSFIRGLSEQPDLDHQDYLALREPLEKQNSKINFRVQNSLNGLGRNFSYENEAQRTPSNPFHSMGAMPFSASGWKPGSFLSGGLLARRNQQNLDFPLLEEPTAGEKGEFGLEKERILGSIHQHGHRTATAREIDERRNPGHDELLAIREAAKFRRFNKEDREKIRRTIWQYGIVQSHAAVPLKINESRVSSIMREHLSKRKHPQA